MGVREFPSVRLSEDNTGDLLGRLEDEVNVHLLHRFGRTETVLGVEIEVLVVGL